jgi:hypothetical protein
LQNVEKFQLQETPDESVAAVGFKLLQIHPEPEGAIGFVPSF